MSYASASLPMRVTALSLTVVLATPMPGWATPLPDEKQTPQRREKRAQSTGGKPTVTPNRTVPPVVPAPSVPHFSSPPLDVEFARVRLFDEPLIPMAGPQEAAEDSELASLILETVRSKSPDGALSFEPFLTSHPGSRWNGALLLGLGVVYRRTGYFTRALESWERSWSLLKTETDPRLRALADRALGELAELSARLGRADRLERLFAEIEGRNVRGPASEKVLAARQGYTLMQNEPEKAFLCGPFGLDRILASIRPGYGKDPKIAAAKSTRQGTSMLQMLQLADSVGLKMQIARRTPGAAVLVPALVHWKAGHFAAVTRESAGRVLIQDPTFGGDLWISQAALDSEASGYFLVPAGELPRGWQAVADSDGEGVWGKGQVGDGDHEQHGTPSGSPGGQNTVPSKGGNENKCKGMAGYTVNLLLVNVHISDTPVGHAPAVGPSMQFTLFYNQREVFQPQIPLYSNLGSKWTFDWFSFAQDNPSDTAADVRVYLRGGGMETYTGMDSGSSAVHYRSRAVVVRTSATSYERRLPDGSIEVFAQSDGSPNAPRRIYLTEYADPQGHRVHFNYSYEPTSGGLRLASAVDALQPTGLVTTFSYESADPLKITKVTDPFGRFATFSYDSTGRLEKITDVMGITSELGYGDNDYVFSLTTPYGTTSFLNGNNGGAPWLEVTDPLGGQERFEFSGGIGTIPAGEPVPTGMQTEPSLLGYRNTYFWDKKAMATMPVKDYTQARIYHWLHSYIPNTASGILESEKLPLEGRLWYNYPDQAGASSEGSAATPSAIGRVLDDGSTQLTRYEYNTRGMKSREIDPVGRETVYVYGTNNVPDPNPATGMGIDLLQVKVKNTASPGGWDVTASYTYNAQHQPLTVTDAAGQVTTYTYDSQGRVETVTTPPRAGITEERTTTYTYDPVTGNVASVTSPGSVDTGYTYDAYGRLRTTTDNDGYMLTYDYDGLDRQTRVTYPDGTYEETVYERMDPVRRRDRLGRWTHTFYDASRRPFATRDPEGRVVTQEWCTCGSLDKLIDANGNATTWERDLQNRVQREVRANGSANEFTYETRTSRLKQVKDPKLQEIHYTYGLDDKLLQTSYINAEHPTPNVTFGYTDPVTSAPDAHGRLRQMVDGTGPTTYAFHPITGSASLGAGQLASVDGPLASDTITYGYDELGRGVGRSLSGVTATWSYDQQSRLQSQGDPIGTFTYGYVSNSGRVQTVTYPNGQTSMYAYHPVSQDLRLQEIHHKKPGGTTLNKFNYSHDVAGNILTWTQQTDTSPANAYDFGYDRVDRLTLATYRTTDPTPTILKRYRYAYDPAGNRTAEQIDDVVTGASYDNMNRLASQQPGGALLFRGTASEAATVTVGGKPAAVSPTNQFSGTVPAPSGTSQVAVQATDYSGNVRTNTYEVNQAGSSKTFTYDANGNMTAEGIKTYEWNAENRLTRVCTGVCQAGTDPPNMLARFTYDGNGRRATKTAGGVTTTYVYDGPQFLEERPSAGSSKRYVYGPGIDQSLAQVIGGTTSYNVADHLGSVVRTTDGLGGPTLTRQYDPWGNLIQGSATSGYAFTGREWDTEAGIYYYRARYYDAKIGRFMSEDTAAKRDEAKHIYATNNPITRLDPLGLYTLVGFPPAERAKMDTGISKALGELRKSCPCLGCDSRLVAQAIEHATWIYDPSLADPIFGIPACGKVTWANYFRNEAQIGLNAFLPACCGSSAETPEHTVVHEAYHLAFPTGKLTGDLFGSAERAANKCFPCDSK